MLKRTLLLSFAMVSMLLLASCQEQKKEEKAADPQEMSDEAHKDHKHKEADKQAEAADSAEEKDAEIAMASYQCPMKCEGDKTYSEEGTCPVCKMKLKELASTEHSEE